jgi:hypothetical protein
MKTSFLNSINLPPIIIVQPSLSDILTIRHLQHQQLRAELLGWAALLISLILLKAEIILKAITRQPPDGINFHLMIWAALVSAIAFAASYNLGKKIKLMA